MYLVTGSVALDAASTRRACCRDRLKHSLELAVALASLGKPPSRLHQDTRVTFKTLHDVSFHTESTTCRIRQSIISFKVTADVSGHWIGGVGCNIAETWELFAQGPSDASAVQSI